MLSKVFRLNAHFLNVNEENLFTRDSYGGSIFLSAPLSEFYRKDGSPILTSGASTNFQQPA